MSKRLECHYTPKHGSWLNIAEIELSVMARQCLSRRVATLDELNFELDAWQADRNADGGTGSGSSPPRTLGYVFVGYILLFN